MQPNRASGVLLHPTGLPGPYGSGDLGPAAATWLEFLAAAKQRLWQVLPLGPTGYGDSPYQSFSTFAGNPLLIAPDPLREEGLLQPADLADYPTLPADQVDFGAVIPARWRLLERAHRRFAADATATQRQALATFVAEEAAWLDDFALFMALKADHQGQPWTTWPPALRHRQPAALAAARERLAPTIRLHQFSQWLFARQWSALRASAARHAIRIIGDIPIFVAHDSADVWANPTLFHLAADGTCTVVAGVPPDYFSETGQLWGNPLYDWQRLAATDYAWWVERVRSTLQRVDLIRIDHFRGFEAYWEVRADEATAVNGRWVPGPGAAVFEAIRAALGAVPIIAEDLGLITPAVEALRDGLNLPGMAVLQFGFGGAADSPHLPHNLRANQVVYTGTHDNDTAIGWFARATEAEQIHLQRYLGQPVTDVAGSLIRMALASVAATAIIPLPDLLRLGSQARLNFPGRPAGNWQWRCQAHQLTLERASALAELTALYGRAEATTVSADA